MPKQRTKLPTDRPPGAPPDPWTAFATTQEKGPGRIRRGFRRFGRASLHEYALALYASCLLAVAMTWPALRYPMYTLPQDLGDPARQAWQVSWAGHVLSTNPVRLWQSNAYYPEPFNFAFGDNLVGYAFAGMIGTGPAAAILRYNVLFVLAHALLMFGAYALVRQLGARPTGAAVAAVAFAYAPWRLAQEGHLDIISAGGIPLALAMLLRGHGYSFRWGFRPDRRSTGWATAGWAVAAWQVTLGFSLGVPFAFTLVALALATSIAVLVAHLRRHFGRGRSTTGPTGRRRRRRKGTADPVTKATAVMPAVELSTDPAPTTPGAKPGPTRPADPVRTPATPPDRTPAPAGGGARARHSAPERPRRGRQAILGWRLLLTDVLGALILVGVGALIAVPYFRVDDTAPAGTEISFFSPPLRALLIGPAESRIWGAAHADVRASLAWPAEMSLLPGFVLYALALLGLVFSVWRRWQRLVLLAGVLVAGTFTLGTTFFEGRWTYLPLFGHFPASFGLRIPGRLMLWVTLLLAILAAGAVAEFVRRAEQYAAARRVPPWPGPWLRLATFVPALLIVLEAWNASAHPVVPAQPAAMRTVTGPMLVLPTAALTDQSVMLWSTTRFQQIANGSGGFAPARQAELRQAVASFPDRASVQYLRERGIGTVLLLRPQAAGTPWQRAGDLAVDSLGITRQDLDVDTVVFRLG